MIQKSIVLFLSVFIVGICSGICSGARAGSFTQVEILKEEGHLLPLTDILNNKKLGFSKYTPSEAVKKRSSYWLRFKYCPEEVETINYLFAPYILYKSLDLYYKANDSVYHRKTGVSVGFEERDLFLPQLYLQLPKSADSTECWLHIDGFFNYSFAFNEVSVRQFVSGEIKNSNSEFFLIGLSFLAATLSLIFFIFLKDRLYLYYAIFSVMLILSRLTFNGYIFLFLNSFIEINSLKSVNNVYTLTYAGVHISLLLYFFEYLQFYKRSNIYPIIFYGFAILRVMFLLINLFEDVLHLPQELDSRILDLIIQFFILICILTTPFKNYKPALLAMCSIVVIMVGNLIFILPKWGLLDLKINSYTFFINLAAVEVLVFAISIAYRNYFLRNEHDKAVIKVVDTLRASERLKDELNKELERKVEERTEQIKNMNEVLKLHNIELKSDVEKADKARIFQKVMDFKEFTRIFPDDDACFNYLAKAKWKSREHHKCRKCEYPGYSEMKNYSRRCGKCSYIESVTSGTIFQHIKFPILKAFYVTYRTTLSTRDDNTLLQMADEINLRSATISTFRQKVLALIDLHKTKKKHKDAWMHLIEHSITR
jgi:hypothetical protein